MPIFNPFYWCASLLVFAVITFLAIAVGGVTYLASLWFTRRQKLLAPLLSLPIALVASLGACGLLWYGLFRWAEHPTPLQPEPTPEEIVGIWNATKASLNNMKHEGGYEISSHLLTFKDDGTFEMVNMPDWWLDGFGRSNKQFDSGSGTWEITEREGAWVVELDFQTLTSHPDGYGAYLYIQGWKPHYLYRFIGDPDEGHTMAYEKDQ